MDPYSGWDQLVSQIERISPEDMSRYDLFKKTDGFFEVRKISSIQRWWRNVTGKHERVVEAAVQALAGQQDATKVKGADALAYLEGAIRKRTGKQKSASNIMQRVLGDTPSRLENVLRKWKEWFTSLQQTDPSLYFERLNTILKDSDFESLSAYPTRGIRKLEKQLADVAIAPLHSRVGHLMPLKITTTVASVDSTHSIEGVAYMFDGEVVTATTIEQLEIELKKRVQEAWKGATDQRIQQAVNDILFLCRDDNDPTNYYAATIGRFLERVSDMRVQIAPQKRYHISLKSPYLGQCVSVISKRDFTLVEEGKKTEFEATSTLTRASGEKEWKGTLHAIKKTVCP